MTTPRWVAGVLLVSGVLFGIVSFGCSSSDPAGPGGGGGGGGGGTLSNTLTGVQTQYFGGANEATFNSLAFFGPLVGNLGVRTWTRQDGFTPDAASAVSCLVDSLVGKVFDYIGGHYVSTGLTGAPPEGARFLLYEINSEGQVNTANQIGYLDVI